MTRYAAFPVATALGALLAATPLALAQQSGKVFQIGILSPAGSPATKAFDALRNGLREFGYIEGSNIKIEYRLGDWDYGRLPAMATDLVRLPVDVIVTDGGPRVVSIAQEATHTIPIVAATAGADPVTAGLAASLAHPGGNVTGFAGLGSELSGKRLQLLKEAVPRVTRVGVLRTPDTLLSHLQTTEEAARTLGLELRIVEAAAPDSPPGSKRQSRVAQRRSLYCPMQCSGTSGRASPPLRRGTGYRPSTRTGDMPSMAGYSPTGVTSPSNSG